MTASSLSGSPTYEPCSLGHDRTVRNIKIIGVPLTGRIQVQRHLSQLCTPPAFTRFLLLPSFAPNLHVAGCHAWLTVVRFASSSGSSTPTTCFNKFLDRLAFLRSGRSSAVGWARSEFGGKERWNPNAGVAYLHGVPHDLAKARERSAIRSRVQKYRK